MTLAASPSGPAFLLHEVSWKFYQDLLEQIGGQNIRVTYDRGDMELMSPLPKHERWKKWIGGMIELLSVELNIPMCRFGSTTFKREDLRKGLEPDECYYIANQARVRDRDEIDLAIDPPPDLVIEVDYLHRAINRESIYSAMGVAEIWKYDLHELQFLVLSPDGEYHQVQTSRAFSFLDRGVIEQVLERFGVEEETGVLRSWRDHVQKNWSKP